MSEEVFDSVEVNDSESVADEEIHPLDEALGAVEAESAPPKHVVKVNGQEMEVSLDELLNGYQTNSAAQEKFREAAAARQEIEEALSLARQDPSVFFKAMGMDPREYAENLLMKQLEEELLSPEEKAQRAQQSELERYRQMERQQREEAEQAQLNQLIAQAEHEIESEIVTTLQEAGIQPTPRVLARMAEIMLASMDESGSRATASQAYSSVRNELQADVHDFLAAHPVEELVRNMPKDTVRALRQHFVNEVKAKVPARPVKSPKARSESSKPSGKTIEDLFGKL